MSLLRALLGYQWDTQGEEGEKEEEEEREKPELHTDLTTTAAIALHRAVVACIIKVIVKVRYGLGLERGSCEMSISDATAREIVNNYFCRYSM